MRTSSSQGSALAGLAAGAILGRHGKRVVVLEHADTRGGAVQREDRWWIDFGHRDGHDVGDCQLVWHLPAGAYDSRSPSAARLRRLKRGLERKHMAMVEGRSSG
jgi:hypothetical protein